MIAALLGDDEHTGLDDAYSRAMKCRKWVVISAVAFFVVHDNHFAPAVFSVLIGKVTLQSWVWEHSTTGALVYSSIQYAAVLVQLFMRYPKILETRFGLRQYKQMMDHRIEIESIGRELAVLGATTSPMDASAAVDRFARLTEREREMRERVEKMQVSQPPGSAYIAAELLIDACRLGTPVVAGIIAFMTAV